ncbi:SRPBCC family protein [Lysobacter humi (ex Lee et al. 2017)]
MTDSASTDPRQPSLPLSWFWPIAAGVLAGLALRFVFSGKPGDSYATMMASFILLTPLVVGASTVYVAERQRQRTRRYHFFSAALSNVLCVISSMAVLWEGLICVVLVAPLFAIVGGLGGMLMGEICRRTKRPGSSLSSFAVLPLVLGFLETGLPLPQSIRSVERQVHIDAPPSVVWRYLQNTGQITAAEVEQGWIYRIGVPLPEIGVTEHGVQGSVRHLRMGKGIHFDQVVAEERPGRYIRWTYRFAPDSVPPRALDDHVAMGGAYFDMLDTSYTLKPSRSGTDLRIRMQYRVSTQFNWYVAPIADALFGNFEETILRFYRRRSESA